MSDTRRDFLKKSAVAGGLVWAAPVISRVSPAAAATPCVADCTGTRSFDVSATFTGIVSGAVNPIQEFPGNNVECLANLAVTLPGTGAPFLTSDTDCVSGDVDGSDGTCSSRVQLEQLVVNLGNVTPLLPVTVTADVVTAEASCTCGAGCIASACVTNLNVIVGGQSLTGGPISICDSNLALNVDIGDIQGSVGIMETSSDPCQATILRVELAVGALQTVNLVVARATASCGTV